MSLALLYAIVTLTLIFYALVIWFLVRLVRAHPAVLADIAPSILGWLRGPLWFKQARDDRDALTMRRLAEHGRW